MSSVHLRSRAAHSEAAPPQVGRGRRGVANQFSRIPDALITKIFSHLPHGKEMVISRRFTAIQRSPYAALLFRLTDPHNIRTMPHLRAILETMPRTSEDPRGVLKRIFLLATRRISPERSEGLLELDRVNEGQNSVKLVVKGQEIDSMAFFRKLDRCIQNTQDDFKKEVVSSIKSKLPPRFVEAHNAPTNTPEECDAFLERFKDSPAFESVRSVTLKVKNTNFEVPEVLAHFKNLTGVSYEPDIDTTLEDHTEFVNTMHRHVPNLRVVTLQGRHSSSRSSVEDPERVRAALNNKYSRDGVPGNIDFRIQPPPFRLSQSAIEMLRNSEGFSRRRSSKCAIL